jgi:hypothetical protein
MKYRLAALILLVMMGVMPALAQENHTVAYDTFRFSYDSSLAAHVNIAPYPGDPPDNTMEGGIEVRHTQFTLYDGDVVPSAFESPAAIRVYNVADFKGYAEREKRLAALQSLLEQKPSLKAGEPMSENANVNTLPFLPVVPAGQIIRARAEYVETPAVKGIRYITVYSEDVGPFAAGEFLYTFQGLSADGQHYISAIFRLKPGMFPAEMENFDPMTFSMATYAQESVDKLNAADPEKDFAPSLGTLNGIIDSFAFEKA